VSYNLDQPAPPPEEKKANTGTVVAGTLGVLAALGGLAAAVAGSGKPSPRGRFQGRRGMPAKRCNTPCGR
jgi:hypothetical protein